MDIQPRPQRRRPTIAKDWQLAVLKKLQSESGNPTEEQRSAAAVETGLDEKWVKNWFSRQRSKSTARSRKSQLAATEPHKFCASSATVPTFKLQLYRPGTPIPHPCYPASQESCPPSSPRTVSAPMSQNNSPLNATLVSHTTTIPTYSRDPLCNRYPDFSQFFRPQAHERFRPALSAPISHFAQRLGDPNMASRSPMHFLGAFNLLNPLHFGGLPLGSRSSTNLHPCPVAFSMRVGDLLRHAALARYPVLPP